MQDEWLSRVYKIVSRSARLIGSTAGGRARARDENDRAREQTKESTRNKTARARDETAAEGAYERRMKVGAIRSIDSAARNCFRDVDEEGLAVSFSERERERGRRKYADPDRGKTLRSGIGIKEELCGTARECARVRARLTSK